MYENVLLPYDGSDGADRALAHASDVARWADARIQVLYVADTSLDSVTVVQNDVVDTLEEYGADVLDEAGAVLSDQGVTYDTEVVQGNPAPTIVEYAAQYDHDLILMPTHGRTGLPRYLLGSVTEKVVRLSSVPVLTMRLGGDGDPPFPYENVLVPTDGSDSAREAATHGLELAATLGATVHVLSVAESAGLGLDVRSQVADEESERRATQSVEGVIAAAESYDVATVSSVERGTPVEAIRDYVDDHDIDAVVMGTTGRGGAERILLGSVAEKTVRSATVPVVTIGGGD